MRYFIFSFLLTVAVGVAFAGDRYTQPLEERTALEICQSKDTNWSVPCHLQSGYTICPGTQNGGQCIEAYVGTRSGGFPAGGQVTYLYCPDAAPNWNGSQCIAQDPCAPKGGIAVDDGSVGPENTKLFMSFPISDDGIYTGKVFCSGGCKASVTKDVTSLGLGVSGRYYGHFNANFTGQSCDPPAIPVGPDTLPARLVTKTSKEYDCLAEGKTYGYVNGAVYCISAPTDKTGKASQTKEQKNPDGTTTKTAVDKSMTCTGDGSCTTITTTTTTVINSDGTTQSTKSEQTKETSEGGGAGAKGSEFCKENPASAICKSGSFAGDCEAGFSCEGDSVGCATAKASWQSYCQSKWLKPGNPSSSTTELLKKDVLPQGGITPITISENGQCPADRSLSIAGRTVTFSYSTFCQFLGMIRPVIIAAGWLVAAYIVFGLGQKSE